jgi:thioredoxin-dependent peroxiredoxin
MFLQSIRPHAAVAALAASALALPAQAALNVGAAAPDFSADAAVGGQPFKFRLAEALKKGPVVLYFYPKAFTSGCTVEAHQFAEATDKFKALNTTVIGMSNDDIDTLKKFSVEACRSKFAVAADAGGKVIKDYDVALKMAPGGMADRVSYLIAPDGKVAAVHASMNPDGHIDAMLQAAEKLKR